MTQLIDKVMRGDRALILAYDQGMEHGPIDFNEESVDPNYILEIALQGRYSAVVIGKGIAAHYYQVNKRYYHKIPLILKLNGKTRFHRDDPVSPLNCTVEEAAYLGAVAVGYTVYVGSPREHLMIREFGEVVREARKYRLATIGWMYPRGHLIKEETPEITAYAARIGMELGADMVKVKYTGDRSTLSWVVKSAGRTKVVVSGGVKKDKSKFLDEVQSVMHAGAAGIAVGRNVWQSEDPMGVTAELKNIVYTS